MDEMEKIITASNRDAELNCSIDEFIDNTLQAAIEDEDYDDPKKMNKLFYKMALLYEVHRIADTFERLTKEKGGKSDAFERLMKERREK